MPAVAPSPARGEGLEFRCPAVWLAHSLPRLRGGGRGVGGGGGGRAPPRPGGGGGGGVGRPGGGGGAPPPPLGGGGGGGGNRRPASMPAVSVCLPGCPHPDLPPQAGEGAR